MAGQALEVRGLKEFRKELRQLADGKTWTKMLGQEQRDLAKVAAGWAKSDAAGLGGPFRRFAGAIAGRGGATGARISIKPEANATFWGAKKRTGARNIVRGDGRPQHPEWVGASWDVAVAGQGPYAINSALASHLDDIERMYGDGIDRVVKAAFPN